MTEKEITAMLEGLYKKNMHDFPRLKKELNKLIKSGRESGDVFLIGAAYYFLALANWRFGGDRDAMLLCALKSVALLESVGTSRMTAKSLNILGIAYHGQENYQMALELYNRSYDIAKRSRRCTFSDKLMAMNNIADCYYEMGDYASCRKVFTKCLNEAKEKTPDRHDNLVVFSVNLASCCEHMGDYEEALSALDFISGWIDELLLDFWKCLYCVRRASICFAMGDVESGNAYAEEALERIREGSYSFEINKELETIAHVMLDLGETDRTRAIMDILNGYSEKSGHTIDLLIACRLSADYYAKTGETALAIEKYAQLSDLNDKRAAEIRSMQLTVHKKIKEAEREINKLNKSVKASKETASRDAMTGLLNRAALLTTASEFIDIAAKKGEKIGAVFLDIDYFKQCNDTYGHAVGDDVIRRVAAACLAEESASIKFARYGGDEFFGIMHGLTGEQVIGIARSICARIRAESIPNEKSAAGNIVTLSAGVVNENITARTNTIIDIVNFADKALYHAKGSGRNAIFMLDYAHMDASGNRDVFVRVEP